MSKKEREKAKAEMRLEISKIIRSLNNRLSNNRFSLRQLSAENKIIKTELTIAYNLRNSIKGDKNE